MPVFASTTLEHWLGSVFAACGVPRSDAELTAAHLLRANLRGVDTHGVMRAPAYMRMLRTGSIATTPLLACEERAGILVVDAGGALGQVGGTFALRKGIEAAATRGLVGVSIRNVGHLGALGLFVEEAAAAGLAALMMQNGPPIMGLPGSTRPAIGNNPLAFAAPVRDGPPLVFDMATSEVSFGRILQHARAGTPLAPSWALDGEGRPTTDPQAARDGMLLPAGGHKGVGLALMVETLAGSLTGLHAADSVVPGLGLPSRFGAFLLLVDPDPVIGREGFDAHLAAVLATLKASSPDARYPGENAARMERERRRDGIPLTDSLVADLQRVGSETGVPLPAPIA